MTIRPSRFFVDEIDPKTNATFCEQLKGSNGMPPPLAEEAGVPFSALQAYVQFPNCTTYTWQEAYGVDGGPPVVMKGGSDTLGFCQTSQPKWSAYRDPSFGHAMMEITGPDTLTYSWYRNADGGVKPAETVVYDRVAEGSCRLAKRAVKRAVKRTVQRVSKRPGS